MMVKFRWNPRIRESSGRKSFRFGDSSQDPQIQGPPAYSGAIRFSSTFASSQDFRSPGSARLASEGMWMLMTFWPCSTVISYSSCPIRKILPDTCRTVQNPRSKPQRPKLAMCSPTNRLKQAMVST